MDPRHRQPQSCQWEGCQSPVLAGGFFCLAHQRNQNTPNSSESTSRWVAYNRPQSDRNQTFSESLSFQAPVFPRTLATAQPTKRANGNGSVNKFPSSERSSPTNEKKQLSDKHTARKSTKQPPNLGQTRNTLVASPTHRTALETPSISPRPAKRARLSNISDGPELRPGSNGSSFSGDGIPHPSKRGMFRQPEERTHKLSAVDDFALRPKKKEAANESFGSKSFDDQRHPHRGESYRSNTSRQASVSSKAPPVPSTSGSVSHTPFVIDLTEDDDPRPSLPQPKTHHTYNGDVVNGNANHPEDGHCWEVPKQPNPKNLPNGQHGGSVQQGLRSPYAQKPPQSVAPSVPTVQRSLMPVNGISGLPTEKQRPIIPTPSNGLGSVRTGPSGTVMHQQYVPPIKERQGVNEVRQFSLNEKNSARFNSSSDSLENTRSKQPATKKAVNSNSHATPARDPIMNPHSQAVRTPPLHQINGAQPAVQSEEPVPTPSTNESPPITAPRKGPLTELLGGRNWKKMTPEERRQFWVSQHDPVEFDRQIYSENNRPFRPGDPLFAALDDVLPSRPTRPAIHFDYIDPRAHYSHQRSEEWHRQKQEEVTARGNRKENHGKVAERAAQRKQKEPQPSRERIREGLPRRVRDNPKWLAALDVLEDLEAQARARRAKQAEPKKPTKEKAKTPMNDEMDIDADVEST